MKKSLPLLLSLLFSACAHTPSDSHLWLEEVEGEQALAWVREQNAKALPVFENDPRYKPTEAAIRKIVLADDRIPGITVLGGIVHNFWQDSRHVQGIWRTTSLADYKAGRNRWRTILDFDALSKQEGKTWVHKGRDCLPPAYDRCLVFLSPGGKDALEVREFSVSQRSFLPAGFRLPEAKSEVAWQDENTLWVATDLGPGSLTKSGYPRIVKLWKRGQALAEAPAIFEAKESDVGVGTNSYIRPEGSTTIISRSPTFFEVEAFLWREGKLIPLPIPLASEVNGVFQNGLLFIPRTDATMGGRTYAAGSLLRLDLSNFSQVDIVLERPQAGMIKRSFATKNHLFALVSENVKARLLRLQGQKQGWKAAPVPAPADGNIWGLGVEDWGNEIVFHYASFLTPTAQYLLELPSGRRSLLRSLPARFRSAGLTTQQRFATSKDGTKIPYFIVHPKGMKLDGNNPTILTAYGGFNISYLPSYLEEMGKVWSERGYAYALANIRGGGEFGPAWHQAALLKNRQRAFDDFIAVAEDLAKTKVTSPRRLGIIGGSNGGLLVGAVATQRPELFRAVLSAVPLLDMLRYHQLLAGNSWMGEYGNPDDPQMRPYLASYSPYHNLQADKDYPLTFFTTSTKDDRVHPAHARKMVARFMELGKPVLYYEHIQGGHSAGANLEEKVQNFTREFVYFYQRLVD